jgi:hypothetical protein
VKLTIDNLDGKGTIDYTSALAAKPALRIERELNAPSICTFVLVPSAVNLAMPLRFGRVVVSDDGGALLFTGYIATEPALELTGEGFAGPVYQALVSAISDDVLLDMQGVPQMTTMFGEPAGQVFEAFTGTVDAARFSFDTSQASGVTGRFVAEPSEKWSTNAGLLASHSRNVYRAASGSITLVPIGSTTHQLSEDAGTLLMGHLQASQVKSLANDVTVCGDEEPSAYVTEIFQGDGVTTLFDLTEEPFFPPSSKTHPLADLFQGPSINLSMWQLQDPGEHIALSSNGLTCSGGNGIDGQTSLSTISSMELGGSLIIEANGVLLNAGSTGVLSGLYSGDIKTQNCIAGFQVSQVNGNNTIAPLISGAVAGNSFSPATGHVYTLRMRIYAKEMQRVLQSYYSVDDSGAKLWGGTGILCNVNCVLEIQDTTNGVSQTPVVLYDGAITNAPAAGTFALLNSANVVCSIRSFNVTQEGPEWVTSIPPGGSTITRRIGTTAQGADCKIERTGKLRFYPTSVPQSGELIFVFYRTKRRAVARLANNVATSSQGTTQIPATARWMGTVTGPKPLSSLDCENAATAILNLASSRGAAWKGTYTGWNFETQGDIWPGDLLALSATSSGIAANVVVRKVRIEMQCAFPQLNKYTIYFANDWAEPLAIKTSSVVPTDTWLPQQPQTEEPLSSLRDLSVSSVSSTAIQINANIAPPSGGGFEVRRRDWSFGPGTDSDLVLRSLVSNFTIPREAVMEQYYVRMYDGSTPPNYSRFSSAVFVNVPL